jgi:hypothetical protein
MSTVEFPITGELTDYTWNDGDYVFFYLDIPAGATSLFVHVEQNNYASTFYGVNKKPVPAADISFGDPSPDEGTYDSQLAAVGLGIHELAVEEPAPGRWWFYQNGQHPGALISGTFSSPQAFWTDFVGCIEV